MSKIGGGGLACSIIGLVMIIMVWVIPLILIGMLFTDPVGYAMLIVTLMPVFQYGGLGLGALGLILGIVGAAKDEKKAPGIVAIVFGAIVITSWLVLMLGLIPI
jgi:hypothetical protein